MTLSVERVAVGTVVCAVAILTVVGLMAIWDWIGQEALWKSFSTIGVLGAAALVIVGIARVAGKSAVQVSPVVESAAWRSARNIILGAMGCVFLFFTILSIMAIWDFVGDSSLGRALESMLLLFVSSTIMLVAFKSQNVR